MVISNITSWFAIELDEIRTRRILREKTDCKQFTNKFKIIVVLDASFRKPEKNSSFYGIQTLDLWDSGSVLFHLSYKSNEDKSLDLMELLRYEPIKGWP